MVTVTARPLPLGVRLPLIPAGRAASAVQLVVVVLLGVVTILSLKLELSFLYSFASPKLQLFCFVYK
jgi:hypothetical protein